MRVQRGVQFRALPRYCGGGMKTPSSRTLDKLRADGWRVAVVERWNSHARVRHDLFGFVDVLAIRGDETLAVQATSASNVAARVRKITADCGDALADVRKAGWRVLVHGWAKRKGRWQCREVDVS